VHDLGLRQTFCLAEVGALEKHLAEVDAVEKRFTEVGTVELESLHNRAKNVAMQAPEQVQALRQAANALIGTAMGPTLRVVLRALLDGEAISDLQPPPKARGNRQHADAPAPHTRTAKKTSTTRAPESNQPADPDTTDWLELRERVQIARAERGFSNAELAAQLGVAVTTLSTIISVRRPPSGAMQRRLTEWVNSEPTPAPAVAAPAAPFHGRSNAHDRADQTSEPATP
jgi:hypothetical protein